MGSFNDDFIIDSIHGDIHLTKREMEIIDTPSFQRLRHIKQLQLGHLTYPNATHNRFVHSIGTLAIMGRLLGLAGQKQFSLSNEQKENLRFAALLHDIGHYPYSHLMEGIDNIVLIEERIDQESKEVETSSSYPDHVQIGDVIVTHQADLVKAIGGQERSRQVADLFAGNAPDNLQLSKFITSSLDLDRFDYLQRDALAVGLPYGRIDLNYLLNNLKITPEGEVGIQEKAIPAVEQFLLARFFMHRTVYYHRTTVAFEETCRQLLRRLRDRGTITYGLPKNGSELLDIVKSDKIGAFTDSFVDNIINNAVSDKNALIQLLAKSIQGRRPPKLLKEVLVLADQTTTEPNHKGIIFKNRIDELPELARKYAIPLEHFIFCEPKGISFEKAGTRYTHHEYQSMEKEQQNKCEKQEREMIQVFPDNSDVPKSILDFDYSIIKKLSNYVFKIYRLYVLDNDLSEDNITQMRKDVESWHRLKHG